MRKNVINKTPKTDWKIGDVCYLYEPWSDAIIDAKIKAICIAKTNHTVNITGRPASDCISITRIFPTFNEAMTALYEANDKLKVAYESRIKSAQDLLQFALDENVSKSEEYTNWEARAAFITRAKELLNIELKN